MLGDLCEDSRLSVVRRRQGQNVGNAQHQGGREVEIGGVDDLAERESGPGVGVDANAAKPVHLQRHVGGTFLLRPASAPRRACSAGSPSHNGGFVNPMWAEYTADGTMWWSMLPRGSSR